MGPGGAQGGGGNDGPPGGVRNPLNAIWITGEFFGVQRAKDMLFQVSMHKVRVSRPVLSVSASFTFS